MEVMPDYATRSATEQDLEDIAPIYSHAVDTSLATFDLDAPDLDYWRARLNGAHPGAHLLVGVADAHNVVGDASSWPYPTRPAFDPTRAPSPYPHESTRGQRAAT